jgi:hypothetical protein
MGGDFSISQEIDYSSNLSPRLGSIRGWEAMSEGENFKVSVIREILKSLPKVSIHCVVHRSAIQSNGKTVTASSEVVCGQDVGLRFFGQTDLIAVGKRLM